ncbi:MAG TPA: carboxypeptidase M32 [Capsulimonadaceae bacterium]|jgi:carboxypeptidase Taq
MSSLQQLKTLLAELTNLGQAAAVLGWDQHTYMPPGGAEARGEQIATLSKLMHEKFTASTVPRLIDGAETEVEGLPEGHLDKHIVRMTRYDYELANKIPSELVAEDARTTTVAQSVWAVARDKNDYAAFAPWLQKNIDIARRKVEYYGYQDQPYDALLNLYEPKMLTRDVQTLFDQVRPVVVAMVKKIVESGKSIDTSILRRHYPEAGQEAFAKAVVTAFGYSFYRGRLDKTVHPFATSFGRDDCRITTRYDENALAQAMMGVFHEAGHAMYEQNVGAELAMTPLSGGCSNSVHESQSRLWENIVGRDPAFWASWFPRLQETFPDVIGKGESDVLTKALNTVEPSLVRVEADEVTYNLHIIIRFELEQALLSGSLSVEDAPAAWNEKYHDYLGITPASDTEGILQDIHWAMGGMGYFPTYSLGNFLSAQLFETATAAKPEILAEIASGQFGALFAWLEENVWRDGRRYFPQEQILKATGRNLETGPYLKYLTGKFGKVYGLDFTV